MVRHSRARRLLQWSGALLTFLILAAWALSATEQAFVPHRRWGICLHDGAIIVRKANVDIEPLVWTNIRKSGPRTLLGGWPAIEAYEARGTSIKSLSLPLWLLLVTTAIPTAWLWHRDLMRIIPGYCPHCGCRQTGDHSGVCANCGVPTADRQG